MSLLENILQKDQLSKEDIVFLLSLENKEDLEKLYEKAYRIKLENVGNKVFSADSLNSATSATKTVSTAE